MRAQFEALTAEVRALQKTVARLEARRGPRDPADSALLLAIAEATGGSWVAASDVLSLARVTPELRQALGDACIGSVVEVGKFFERMRDVVVAGFVVQRRAGHRRPWRVIPA